MNRSALLSIFAVALASITLGTGCAAQADSAEGASASAALMSDASLVGKYYDRSVPHGGIAKMTLAADGTFTAQVDAAGTAECITAPCFIPQSGTWTTVKEDGAQSLSLAQPGEAARSFSVTKYEATLTITGPTGAAQTLTLLDADQCLTDSDCDGDLVCAPKVCAMMCAQGSPFCCGASLCAARSAK